MLRHAAASHNGTHSTELLSRAVIHDLERHDVTRPLFAFIAWHAVHDPLEVPAEYKDRFASTIQDESRRTLAGMINNLDEAVANITAALRARGMWSNTLTIVSTDNGGPVCLNMSRGTQRGEQSLRDCGTNNFPLREPGPHTLRLCASSQRVEEHRGT